VIFNLPKKRQMQVAEGEGMRIVTHRRDAATVQRIWAVGFVTPSLTNAARAWAGPPALADARDCLAHLRFSRYAALLAAI